jgi:hypothetical protein
MSVTEALEKLALYRFKKTRKSEETFKKGLVVLNSAASSNRSQQGNAMVQTNLHPKLHN